MSTLTIITINYNNANGLKKTFDSVFSQTIKPDEYIVIDGKSEDGSLEIINLNTTQINYWISEKDNGIYDALNKGILKANSDYILFLNSGDTFYSNTVIEFFKKQTHIHHKYGIIYGNVCLEYPNKKELIIQNDELSLDFFRYATLNHQSTFFKKTMFETFSLYNTDNKVTSDFEFFLKVFINAPQQFFHINETICNFNMEGLSQNKNSKKIIELEKEQIFKKYYPSNYKEPVKKKIPLSTIIKNKYYSTPLLIQLFKPIKYLYKKNKKN